MVSTADGASPRSADADHDLVRMLLMLCLLCLSNIELPPGLHTQPYMYCKAHDLGVFVANMCDKFAATYHTGWGDVADQQRFDAFVEFVP